MFRKNKPLEATKDDPFKNDKLGREENIIALDKIMRDVDTPLVMTVSASWGSGKSSFVRMWKAYLEKEGHPCILFNAWEHDFTHQPFLDFMGEIYEYMDTHNGGKKNVFNGAKKRFKKYLPLATALCGVGSAIAKAVPGGQVPGALLEAGQATLAGICKEHTDLKRLLGKFKKQDFPNFLEKSQLPSEGNKPFYFFVDELDRCEPSYAIALLETINHIFDVEGIVFVLAVDKEKLGSMAKTRYGSAFDADGYLERFIDVEYCIPEPDTKEFINHLYELHRLKEYPNIKLCETRLKNAVEQCSQDLELSLRDLEKYFRCSQILFKNFRPLFPNRKNTANQIRQYPIEIYVIISMTYFFKKQNFEALFKDPKSKDKYPYFHYYPRHMNIINFKNSLRFTGDDPPNEAEEQYAEHYHTEFDDFSIINFFDNNKLDDILDGIKTSLDFASDSESKDN